MILLSEQSQLGTGRHRKSYSHKEDEKRCIKIVYNRGDCGDKEIHSLKCYWISGKIQ
ncbi:YrbL family protein, partial [Escherichia marmotae]|nr:YrbL family protein [Escherichia marmotae]